jgi:hypothetical protein
VTDLQWELALLREQLERANALIGNLHSQCSHLKAFRSVACILSAETIHVAKLIDSTRVNEESRAGSPNSLTKSDPQPYPSQPVSFTNSTKGE